MKSPVFIDNLNGVHNDKLYYYSENRLIDKNKFMEHYLKIHVIKKSDFE